MCEVLERVENKGKTEGRAEGEHNLIALYASLKQDGRSEEAEQIMKPENIELRRRLYKEYHI